MRIAEFCNRDVVVIRRERSALEAAQLMRTHHVGDVVVVEERSGRSVPVGIVTDRDVVVEVIAKGIEPQAVTVGDVMSTELTTSAETDEVADVLELMRVKSIRRLPIVDTHGSLVGIVTVDDLIDLIAGLMSDVGALVLRQPQRERRTRP